MLTPKERLKTEVRHMDSNSVQVTKVAKTSAINHFEQVMSAPLIKATTEEPVSRHKLSDGATPAKNMYPSLVKEEPSKSAELMNHELSPLNRKNPQNNRLTKRPSDKQQFEPIADETDAKQTTSSHHFQDSNMTQAAKLNLRLQQGPKPLKTDGSISVNEPTQYQHNKVSEHPNPILKPENTSKQHKTESPTLEKASTEVHNSALTHAATQDLSLQQGPKPLKTNGNIAVNESTLHQHNKVSEHPSPILKPENISKQQKTESPTLKKANAEVHNSTLTHAATQDLNLQPSPKQLKTDTTQGGGDSQAFAQQVKTAKQAALFVRAEKPSRSNSELSSTPLMTKPSRHVDNAPVLSSGSKMLKAEKSQEEPHIQHHISAQQNNTPGQIILANLKMPEPMNQQLHNLVSQLIDKVQILVPNLGNQNRVQLVLEQGQLKGTEITITLQNNQLNVTLSHSGQHTELLQQLRPELLERLQKMNTDQQVRVITTSHEQAAQNDHQEQGQHESSQKSRVFDLWLEEQENA